MQAQADPFGLAALALVQQMISWAKESGAMSDANFQKLFADAAGVCSRMGASGAQAAAIIQQMPASMGRSP